MSERIHDIETAWDLAVTEHEMRLLRERLLELNDEHRAMRVVVTAARVVDATDDAWTLLSDQMVKDRNRLGAAINALDSLKRKAR